jgi:hypothetical protein
MRCIVMALAAMIGCQSSAADEPRSSSTVGQRDDEMTRDAACHGGRATTPR